MKDFEGVLALQVESIVANLRHVEEERSGLLLRRAERQARELMRSARRRLFQQGREAIQDARRRRARTLRMAKRRIRAAAGQRIQRQYAAVLRQGWPALGAELDRRWSDARARAAWCEAVAEKAHAAFGPVAWTIEHPADWTPADSERMARTLADLEIPPPTFQLDESVRAGLRIRHGTACLDGTIDGLLAERTRVESRLLATWEDLEPERGHEQHD